MGESRNFTEGKLFVPLLKFAMLQGILGAFCVRIPVSFLMSRMVPVNLFHIGLATPASSLVQTMMCVLYYCSMNKKNRRLEER